MIYEDKIVEMKKDIAKEYLKIVPKKTEKIQPTVDVTKIKSKSQVIVIKELGEGQKTGEDFRGAAWFLVCVRNDMVLVFRFLSRRSGKQTASR